MREIYPTVLRAFHLVRPRYLHPQWCYDTTILLFPSLPSHVLALHELFLRLKYFIMESTTMTWLTRIRNTRFKLVLSQDKMRLDSQANSSTID
jgi:hypothetical protein